MNRRMNIERCTADDFRAIVCDLPAFWGSDRTRAIHHPMFLHEFGDTAFVVRNGSCVAAYLFGFVSQTEPVGYVHLIAVRDSHRRRGLGQALYARFAEVARRRGCSRLKAITTPSNSLSIAFHRSLGMRIVGAKTADEVCVVRDYAGPGEDRVVFERSID
ncbi:MAG TPA: GNAT family N-acetyltransferase [Pirellulales bacterium]|nr:GNAT family N-acetyltransferase [Pirellulales bacterium]